MNNNVSLIPSAAGGAFRIHGHGLLVAFDSVLRAIENKMLVAADDVGDEQLAEINRELGLMRWQVDLAFKDAGLAKMPGSFHLMRRDQIDAFVAEETTA